MHIVEFIEIFRQKEQQFIDILNSVRKNNVSEEQLKILHMQMVKRERTADIH